MGFFILTTQKSMRSENQITWHIVQDKIICIQFSILFQMAVFVVTKSDIFPHIPTNFTVDSYVHKVCWQQVTNPKYKGQHSFVLDQPEFQHGW